MKKLVLFFIFGCSNPVSQAPELPPTSYKEKEIEVQGYQIYRKAQAQDSSQSRQVVRLSQIKGD